MFPSLLLPYSLQGRFRGVKRLYCKKKKKKKKTIPFCVWNTYCQKIWSYLSLVGDWKMVLKVENWKLLPLGILSGPTSPFRSPCSEMTHQDLCGALSVRLQLRHVSPSDQMRDGGVSQKRTQLRGVLPGGSRLHREPEALHQVQEHLLAFSLTLNIRWFLLLTMIHLRIQTFSLISSISISKVNYTGRPWQSRKWQPTPVFLPGKSHGWRSLAGYSLWGCKESDMTERLLFLSLEVLWLRLCASAVGGEGSLPGQGTKILHATWQTKQNKEKTSYTGEKQASILPNNRNS